MRHIASIMRVLKYNIVFSESILALSVRVDIMAAASSVR